MSGGKAGSRPRLLVLINNFPPDRGGGAAVFGDMCYSLAARGFDVTVRCAYPYYPEWRDKSGRNGLRIWRYEDQGVHVERYGLYIPADPNSIVRRLAHELSYLLSLLRSLHRGRNFDLIMAYCPAVSSVVLGVCLKLLWRKPLWLNVQDLAAEAAAASGLVKQGWLGRLLRGVQAWLFNRADIWSTISPVMAQRIGPLRRRGQPLLFLPNWLDQALGSEIEARRRASPARALHEPVRLLYAGNIGKKQNLLALLKTLAVSSARFEFLVHGNGAQAADVERWMAETRDPRFRFGPFLDAAGFAGVLDWTDFFVITETGDSGASFMPSKLIPGIASGAPILAVCDAGGPLGREVAEHELGPLFSWQQDGAVAGFLGEIAGQPQRLRQWSENALKRAAQYDREGLIQRFDEGLRGLLAGKPPNTDY